MDSETAPDQRRVLAVVTSPERRGAEVFAWHLAAEMTHLGIETEMVALVPTSASPRLDIPVLARTRWSMRGLMRLAQRARRTDVLVANGGDTLIPTAIVAGLLRKPFLYRNVGDPAAWGSVALAGLRLGVPLRRARTIVALSPAAAREFSSRYRIPSDRISVVPNAAPSDRFPPAEEPERVRSRQQLALDPHRHWIAFVGALSAEKRPLLAIESVAHDHDLGLLVVGDGPLRSICATAAAAAPAQNVRLLGTTVDVATVYAAVDAVVIPSRTEGMPGVAIEAGMRGRPVVAFDVGAMAEVVVDGVTGRLVHGSDPDQLHTALIDAIATRAALGTAAAQRCHEKFAMATVARQWRDLIIAAVHR